MLLKARSFFLVAAVGLWGRHVIGVATRRRGPPAVGDRSVSGGGRQKVDDQTLGLALSERTKMRAATCGPHECPEWPTDSDGRYRVLYKFVGGSAPLTTEQQEAFKWIVAYFGQFTNIKFEETTDQVPFGKFLQIMNFPRYGYCHISPKAWSWNTVVVSTASYCLTAGRIAQVLMQAGGFFYEHERPDRDDYVTVQNICPRAEPHMNNKQESVAFSTSYDMASVLQLPPSDQWYNCPPEEVSFVAKDPALQPVLEADKMAPSTCDLAALAERFPGPVAGPKCVPHELPTVCRPVPDCEQILRTDEATCREECKLRCQHNLAPTSARPACRLLPVDEIAFEMATDSEGSPSASRAGCAAHSPAPVGLLGAAVGLLLGVPLFMHC